jgi:phosphatidate cytidylyltransferase
VAGIAGWVVVFPTWLAFLSLHDVSPWLLLSFALIVWVADIAAYFVGKSIGKHKLAPAISPGKTIEGALGAIVGVALYFFLWQHLSANAVARGDTWARDLQSHGWVLFAFFIVLGVVSVLGDLFESWMKRGVGMKDSSRLLPGHGGMLDRIDALTSTLPIAGLYVMLMPRGIA